MIFVDLFLRDSSSSIWIGCVPLLSCSLDMLGDEIVSCLSVFIFSLFGEPCSSSNRIVEEGL